MKSSSFKLSHQEYGAPSSHHSPLGLMAHKAAVLLPRSLHSVFGHLFGFSACLRPQMLSFSFSRLFLGDPFSVWLHSKHVSNPFPSYIPTSELIFTLVLIRIFTSDTTYRHLIFSIILKHLNINMSSLWLSLLFTFHVSYPYNNTHPWLTVRPWYQVM